jgi:hypothetical protein
MKNKHKRQTFNIMAIVLFYVPGVVGAMDLRYDPNLDAPTSTHAEPEITPKQPVSVIKKQSDKALTNEKQSMPPEEGWSVKAPVISSDKTPYITDEREAVRISEEQRWLNEAERNGKKYDENPFNSENYRITVEAEYSF